MCWHDAILAAWRARMKSFKQHADRAVGRLGRPADLAFASVYVVRVSWRETPGRLPIEADSPHGKCYVAEPKCEIEFNSFPLFQSDWAVSMKHRRK